MTCVVLSLFLKHVSFLPPLSETGVHAPEKFLFTTTLSIVSFLLLFTSILLFKSHQSKKKRVLNIISSSTLFISSVGLFLLGIVPLREPNVQIRTLQDIGYITIIHLSGAGIFFVFFAIQMFCNFFLTFSKKSFWTWYKLSCILLLIFAWPIAPVLGGILTFLYCSISQQTYCPDTYIRATLGALNQYLMIFCVILYSLAYTNDLENVEIKILEREIDENEQIIVEDSL
eukprot:gene5150-8756_t